MWGYRGFIVSQDGLRLWQNGPGSNWQLHYNAARNDVWPGAFAAVKQHPEIAYPCEKKRNRRTAAAQQSLQPVDGAAIFILYLDTPGLHAKGLAAMSPEPAEKQVSTYEHCGE